MVKMGRFYKEAGKYIFAFGAFYIVIVFSKSENEGEASQHVESWGKHPPLDLTSNVGTQWIFEPESA